LMKDWLAVGWQYWHFVFGQHYRLHYSQCLR
jgi:hypothetical protein